MLRQLLSGGFVSLCNIALHAVAMGTVVTASRRASSWQRGHPQAWLAAVMVATATILLVAHTAEVTFWALAYSILDVAPEADAFYFAFVNYTTLGYGDVVPVERWRLLGPVAAMNGVLLFGWSTAVIFEVLRNAMRIRDAGEP